MVENYHDVPFYPDSVPPLTIAAMTLLVVEIRRCHPRLPIGVNVLRNDATAALAIASVTGAGFVRVNVHVGAAVTDQGLVMGQAHQTLRLRHDLGAEIAILADVRVKHARPLAERPLTEEAQDLRRRGLADAVILTGPVTGAVADPGELARLREALPDCPILIGSGLSTDNLAAYGEQADGFIVGTSFKQGDPPAGGVSAERVAQFVAALRLVSLELGRSDRKESP